MKRINNLTFFLIFVFSLSACSCGRRIEISEPVTTLANETCLDTFDSFAFSTPDIDDPSQELFLPGEPWQKVDILPQEIQSKNYRIAAIRSVSGGVEIWAQPYRPSEVYSTDDHTKDFWVFKTHEKIWHKVHSQLDGSDIFVDQLFVLKDGSIWGRNVWKKTENHNGSPVLSRYDETINQFKPITDTSQIPNGKVNIQRNSTQWPEWNSIILDSKDIFWIFVNEDKIFSYDPSINEVKRHASLAKFPKIMQLDLATDGSILFRVLTTEYTLHDGQIFRYIPKTDEIKPIILPQEPWPAPNSILIDQLGRLWLGVFGWQEPTGEWKPLHPKIDDFIPLNRDSSLWQYYQPPSVFMESSDGRMWFSIPRSDEWKTFRSGIAWYDSIKNEGCWFTSEGFNVAEDSHNNIWLIADGSIYRYSLDL